MFCSETWGKGAGAVGCGVEREPVALLQMEHNSRSSFSQRIEKTHDMYFFLYIAQDSWTTGNPTTEALAVLKVPQWLGYYSVDQMVMGSNPGQDFTIEGVFWREFSLLLWLSL